MKHIFTSEIKDGRMSRRVANDIAICLQSFENSKIEVTIAKKKNTRSLRQNNYLHLLFSILKDELNALGNEFKMEEVKELCKAKFALIDVVNEKTGEVIGQRIQGTHEMTTMELNVFIESIIRWSADFFHITLPYPGENFEIKFEH